MSSADSIIDGSGYRGYFRLRGLHGAASVCRPLRLALAAPVLLASAAAALAPGDDDRDVSSVSGASSEPVLVEDNFVETVIGSGPVDVSVVDAVGFNAGDHGQRVRDIFLANTKRARLVQIDGGGTYEIDGRRIHGINTNGTIRHALLRGGGIFWTASDDSPAYQPATRDLWFFEGGRPFHKDARTFAGWFRGQNTLIVSSLENPTGGDRAPGRNFARPPIYCDDFDSRKNFWIPLCGMTDDYVAHSGVGLDKVLFVGAIHPSGIAGAAIRADGVFAPHAIYVESPDGSTSQATPVLAAYATNLAAANPTWGAARLKRELLALAVEEVIDHATGGSTAQGNAVIEKRIVKVIRPACAPGRPCPEPPPSEPPPEPPPAPPGPCVADAERLCLHDSRYAVAVAWRTPDDDVGSGRVVHGGTDDSGLFTFFDPNNWEILIKVLDGCTNNGHVWVYGASTTDLAFTIAVTDTATGRVRRYSNEAGRPAAAITDTKAFPGGCQVSMRRVGKETRLR